MSAYLDANGAPQPERRQQANLRALFDDVVRLVEPFFRSGGSLNGSRPDFWVARSIRDAYPELSNEEVHLLASAAVRYFSEHARTNPVGVA